MKNPQNLLSNLGHKFRVISVSETWNPNIEKSGNKPKTLEGNYNYHGVKRKSLKSGVDFMSKEGINFSLERILK